MKVSDSIFLKTYRNQVTNIILKKHPNLSKDELKREVDLILLRDVKNPPALLENSYTHEERESTLLGVIDWAMDTKPIIAANGTFFKQHKDGINPNALMLKKFLTTRKSVKKEMFSLEDETLRLYKMLDLGQGNWKVLANSYYGGSGMKASAFYNKMTAPATTLTAQSVISTCMTTFEAFLVSNFSFVDINECYYWISVVLKEDEKVDKWVVRKSLEEVYERIVPHVIGISEDDKKGLYDYLSTLSEDELTRLYWKNNMVEFTDAHPYVKDLHDSIFACIRDFDEMTNENDFSVVPEEFLSTVKEARKPLKTWNQIVSYEKFYDPNKPPKTVLPFLETLKSVYMKYVYVQYMYTDRIYKLKNFKRSVVTVIDTDSNILSVDPWMEYCLSTLKRSDYGRSRWDNIFIGINTLAYIITAAITDNLLFYGLCSNVAEEHRGQYSMKNEFFFSNLILAKVKKRYLSKVLLREGTKLSKPKFNVTGYDFKKASTSESASNFFMYLVKDKILNPENVNIKEVMMELQRFRKEIKKSLERGERTYLPMGSAKELEAYDSPESEQGVRGAIAWNLLYPDSQIEFPSKVSILKTTITSMEKITKLEKTHPEIYNSISENIFGDRTGFFVKKSILPSGKEKYKTDGLSVLAIPIHARIPEWVIPYIDYSTVTNSVLAPFKSITETFGLPSIEEGPTGKKTTGFTNIVRI